MGEGKTMNDSRFSPSQLPRLTHPDGTAIKVLVVDDEPSLAELVSMGTRMLGWESAIAHDGPEAVATARNFAPDVLVLDWMLPGFDGPEVLRKVRTYFPEVPVLFLTAKDAVEDRIEGLGAGADDYVAKPSASRRCSSGCTGWSNAPEPPARTPPNWWWAIWY